MRLKILALCWLLVGVVGAEAAPTVGAGFYGIQSDYWKDSASAPFFAGSGEKALSLVWGTFGLRMGGLSRFMLLPGKKFLEIHPWNGCC